MKYCVSALQEDAYLSRANEIIFEYKDRKALYDFIDRYPAATIILRYDLWSDDKIDWKEIEMYNSKAEGKFILALTDITTCIEAGYKGIKFYHLKPVTTYFELRALKELGVCYIIPGAPLFFDMEFLSSLEIPIRCYPNESNLDGLPRADRVCGPWIRPEDVEVYEDYVTTLEFKKTNELSEADWLKKERGLFRIYHDERAWPGKINMIIDNIKSEATNRMIQPQVAKARLNCKQKCMSTSMCRVCPRAFELAYPERIQKYVDSPKGDGNEEESNE